MRLVALKYNSLFIRYFRERMRPHVAGSYAAVVLVCMALFLLGNRETFTNVRWERFILASLPRWDMSNVFFGMALLQGAVLLLAGTLSAYRMALQDRLNGILDLFRATPTAGVNHVIGLLLGAPVTEWLLFFLLTPVSLAVALMGGVKLMVIVSFYVSLVLCALFYHSAGILAGVRASHKQSREAISFAVLLILFHVVAVLGGVAGSSIAYHATCLPAFVNLLGGIGMGSAPPVAAALADLNLLFGAPIPSLMLQALVQIPLIVFACLAMERKISCADKPILSRPQLLALTALLLFIFIGHLPPYKEPDPAGRLKGFNIVLSSFFGLFFIFSVVFSVFITPTALGYRKGLNRMKKLGLQRLNLFDEQAGNTGWLMLYCGLVALAYFALCVFFKVFLPVSFLSFVILSCFIFWTASALEFSRLRFPGKETVLTTAFLLFWVAVPITELIITKAGSFCFTVLSPLFTLTFWGGFAPGNDIIAELPGKFPSLQEILSRLPSFHEIVSGLPSFREIVAFFTPPYERGVLIALSAILGHLCLFGITALFIYLAARERKRLRAEVAGAPGTVPFTGERSER